MSSENRRASLRSRMNAPSTGDGGRVVESRKVNKARPSSSTSSRISSGAAVTSPKGQSRSGGRRGRASNNKLQPKINDSLKATKRGGGGAGRRNSTEILKAKAKKELELEEDILVDLSEDDGVERKESEGNIKVKLGTGQSVRVQIGTTKSTTSTRNNDEKSTKIIKAEEGQTKMELSKEDELMLLKDFDLNVTYGACRGISRIERYERALKYSLQPPPLPIVADVLRKHPEDLKYTSCIWDQNDLLRVRK